MDHRGFIVLNHELTELEYKAIQKSKYLMAYNSFVLKIMGGSHFLTMREAIKILYPNIKVDFTQEEEYLTKNNNMMILNDYDLFLSDDRLETNFKVPQNVDNVSLDQLLFLSTIIQDWKYYDQVNHIGLWPEVLLEEIVCHHSSILKINNSLHKTILMTQLYIMLGLNQYKYTNKVKEKIKQ